MCDGGASLTTVLEGFDGTLSDVSDSVRDAYEAINDLLTSVDSTARTAIDDYTPGESLTYQSAPPVSLEDGSPLVTGEAVFLGEVPDITAIDISIGTAPEVSFARPDLEIPPPPNVTWPAFLSDPPVLNGADLPTAPNMTLPDPPSIEDIVVPAPPEVAVPDFNGVAPTIDLTPPVVDFSWSESTYTTALTIAIRTHLASGISAGGEGYNATIEQQIYDREVSKVVVEEEKDYLAALEDGAERGWMSPPGMVAGNIIEISDRVNKRREDINRAIIKRQAELAQRNTHLAIEAAVKIESLLIRHHSNMQQRSYEAARFAIDSALELYRARVDAYRARVKAFAVAAEVYEARIRAEIVRAELYKAQIEGVKASTEANVLRVERYKAQLHGISALVEMYKTEMQAAGIIAQHNKNQIEAYRLEIQVFKTRVEAIKAEADGYVAQVRGEAARAGINKADAEAYKARVHAYNAQAQAELEGTRAAVERLKADLEVYKAQISRYRLGNEEDIGLGKANAKNAEINARLQIYQSRYDAASRNLEAANYQAENIARAAEYRAQAISAEAQSTASVSFAEASATAAQAATEARTIIAVARSASETTHISENHRNNSRIIDDDINTRGSSETDLSQTITTAVNTYINQSG